MCVWLESQISKDIIPKTPNPQLHSKGRGYPGVHISSHHTIFQCPQVTPIPPKKRLCSAFKNETIFSPEVHFMTLIFEKLYPCAPTEMQCLAYASANPHPFAYKQSQTQPCSTKIYYVELYI